MTLAVFVSSLRIIIVGCITLCRLLVLGCSELEKKVDILTKMTDEVTKRQQEREDTAQQYKRYLVECVDMTM